MGPCQNGTVPETGGVAPGARAKGNICKSGGVSGERAAPRARSLSLQETLATESTAFLLPCFILNAKAFHTTVTPSNHSLTSVASVETIYFHAPWSAHQLIQNRECDGTRYFNVPWKDKGGKNRWRRLEGKKGALSLECSANTHTTDAQDGFECSVVKKFCEVLEGGPMD